MTDPLFRLRRFLRELKRRNVYKVAVAYVAVAFVAIQAADLLVPQTTLPGYADNLLIYLSVFGFPIALVVAWAFEMTPEGVRRTETPEGEGTNGSAYQWVGLALAVALAGGVWYVTTGNGESPSARDAAAVDTARTEEPAGPRLGARSIAVLPFANLSGSAEAEPFVNGIHDDLLTRLSNISDLKVISRTSVLPYRETGLSLPAIADSLGVRWILEGGVQQAGEQVQVNAQLIDAQADVHRWAESYHRKLTTQNLFAIQSELTQKIARSLEAQITTEEQNRVQREPTGDLTAYRLYAQGRQLLDRRTGESMRRAVEYFRRALERDSTYAVAWSGLADAVGLHEVYGYTVPERAPTQEGAARRALELDPNLAEAHASLAYYLMNENRGASAVHHLRAAVELQPSYAQAHHWLGWLLPPLGRLEEGREHASLAVELNPGHSAAAMVHAEVLVATGRAEAGLDEVRRIRRMRPTYTAAPMNEALALLHLGRPEEARRVAEEGLPKARDYAPRARTLLAIAAAALDDSAGARHWVQRMKDAGDSPAYIGLVLAAVGDTDAAYAAFREEDSWPGWATIGLRYWFPERLAPLRDDSRYRELIRAINQEWGLNPDGSLPDSVDVSFGPQSDE